MTGSMNCNKMSVQDTNLGSLFQKQSPTSCSLKWPPAFPSTCYVQQASRAHVCGGGRASPWFWEGLVFKAHTRKKKVQESLFSSGNLRGSPRGWGPTKLRLGYNQPCGISNHHPEHFHCHCSSVLNHCIFYFYFYLFI